MSYSVRLPNYPGNYWRIRVLPKNFDLTDFNWEKSPLWGLPPVKETGGVLKFQEDQFVILEQREELKIFPSRMVSASSFLLLWKDRTLIPDMAIKKRIGAFLHAKGLPTDCMKGNGQLIACLRIIHATHLGFNLEAFYEEVNPLQS